MPDYEYGMPGVLFSRLGALGPVWLHNSALRLPGAFILALLGISESDDRTLAKRLQRMRPIVRGSFLTPKQKRQCFVDQDSQ